MTDVVLCEVCGLTKGRRAPDGSWVVNPANRYTVNGRPVCCYGFFLRAVWS